MRIQHLTTLLDDDLAKPTMPPSAHKTKPGRKSTVWIISLMGASLCLCATACAGIGGWGALVGVPKAAQARNEIEQVIDLFMREMEQPDTTTAWALFSTRSQRQMSQFELEEMVAGTNYVLFDGYKSVMVINLKINMITFHTDPNKPQGVTAHVSGPVVYDGDVNGRFVAVLEEEGKAWKLHHIYVTVPSSKVLTSDLKEYY